MAVTLTIFEIFQGMFSLIFILVAVIIASLIIQKYFQYRSLEHLFVGLAWIGLAGPWFSDAIVFLSVLIGNLVNSKYTLQDYTILTKIVSTLMTYYIPIALLFWLVAFTKLLKIKNRKFILIIFSVIHMVFIILFIIFTFYNFSLLGIYQGPFSYQWGTLTMIFYLYAIFLALFTGISFGYQALKSEAPENKLKGKFLLLSFALFTLGAIIPYLWFDLISLMLSRLILVGCVISFYIGLNMPNFVKKLVIK
jgi:hypothetical protein